MTRRTELFYNERRRLSFRLNRLYSGRGFTLGGKKTDKSTRVFRDQEASGGEEVDWIGDGDSINFLGTKVKQFYTLFNLALKRR